MPKRLILIKPFKSFSNLILILGHEKQNDEELFKIDKIRIDARHNTYVLMKYVFSVIYQ